MLLIGNDRTNKVTVCYYNTIILIFMKIQTIHCLQWNGKYMELNQIYLYTGITIFTQETFSGKYPVEYATTCTLTQ